MTRTSIGIVCGVLIVALAGFAAAPPGTGNPDLKPERLQEPVKTPAAPAHGENEPQVTPAGHAGIAGRWEISRPARALLGHDKDMFQNADLEIEFVDRFPDKTPDDKDIAEEAEAIRKDVMKAGHTILAMGRMSYPTDAPQPHAFALSQSRGKTSLWVVFPFNALEVPVSLVPGHTREKDLLFLWPTVDGAANCWAFQRRGGKPDGDGPKPEGVKQPDAPKLGTLTGRFVFDGGPPPVQDLLPALSKLDPAQPQVPGPDGRFDGVEGVYREFLARGIRPKTDDPSLLVGKDGGVANVVIWVASKDVPWTAPKEWQPTAIKLKHGNYVPRVTVAAAGQSVLVENHDPVGFHFRIDPASPRNIAANQLLKPNAADAPLRLTWEETESVPARYGSNLGPWATGWLFVHRNSFVAVSGADGSFALPNLPPGEWEFRVWHERRGFVKHWPKGLFKHTIKPGENDLGVIKLKSEYFTAE
jgi:hypothetical protein